MKVSLAGVLLLMVRIATTSKSHDVEYCQMYNVTFRSGDYEALVRAKPGDLVYCDPPYKDTKSYSRIERFDYERFWGWADHLAETGVSVYVSELLAPDGWEPIWSKSQNRSVKRQGDVTTTESLFTK